MNIVTYLKKSMKNYKIYYYIYNCLVMYVITHYFWWVLATGGMTRLFLIMLNKALQKAHTAVNEVTLMPKKELNKVICRF